MAQERTGRNSRSGASNRNNSYNRSNTSDRYNSDNLNSASNRNRSNDRYSTQGRNRSSDRYYTEGRNRSGYRNNTNSRKGSCSSTGKIKKYRKPLNLNIGMIIFSAVFIYVAYFVVNYFQYSPPKPYEVKEGSLSVNTLFRGIALREEVVVTTQNAGYLNYYVREGERVANGNLVYTVDETGRLNEYMESIHLGQNSLSSEELAEFRNEIVNFMHGFDPHNFGTAYDFKYSIQGTVLRLANADMLENLDKSGTDFVGTIKSCYAQGTGIVSYWTDGYESLTADQVTADTFEKKVVYGDNSEDESQNEDGEENDSEEDVYRKTQLLGTTLAAVGDPAYKLSTNENWSIVIPVDEAYGAMLEEEGYVKVRFLKNQYESWGAVKLLQNSDGNTYAQLSFTNSMVTFVSERFLEIELILDEETGLKIPNSSIAEREFFLVPEEFVLVEDGSSECTVIRQTYLEDGTISSEVVDLEIYSYDEESKEYYFDIDVLGRGDILLKRDSQDSFTVSKSATLIGVYNMNKGYADFREINVLAQNEEYAIVQSNTRYGLNVYDNIVLNADTVDADQFIYE